MRTWRSSIVDLRRCATHEQFPLESGCLRATAALRADPSPDGKFTVNQVRRVACDQPPPPSPNGTTPTHTTEYSSTESVLLNPNRRHFNPPMIAFVREFGSPCVLPMMVCFGFPLATPLIILGKPFGAPSRKLNPCVVNPQNDRFRTQLHQLFFVVHPTSEGFGIAPPMALVVHPSSEG